MMNEQAEMMRKLRASAFVHNNGRVLLTINILRHKYVSLRDARYALEKLEERQYLDSLNFLVEAGYIHLRDTSSKEAINLADVEDYEKLEAKVTAQGIRLLGGELSDKMVDV